MAKKPAAKKPAAKKPAAKKPAVAPSFPPFVQDPVIDAWWKDGFPARVGVAATDTSDEKGEVLAGWFNRPLPGELRAFLAWCEAGAEGTTFGEWRIATRDFDDGADANAFEALLLSDQQDYLGTAVAEAFNQWVLVGTAGDGDSWFVPVHVNPHACEVWHFEHDSFSLDAAAADSLSSFAWLNKLYEDVDRDDVTPADLEAGLTLIEERAAPTWHYGKLLEAGGVQPEFKGDQNALVYFYRSLWLVHLLRNPGHAGVRDVAELFGFIDQGQFKLADALAQTHLDASPVTALYWLWRTFFLGQQAELESVLARTRGSSSKLVADAARLVDEIGRGRKQVGTIEDIHALRDQVVALDLDPARAKAREKEQAQRKAEAEARAAADQAEGEALCRAHADAELPDLALRHVDRPALVEAVFQHLRTRDASLAWWLQRLEFLTGHGFSRGNCAYNHEADQVVEALGDEGDVRLVPLLLARLEAPWSIPLLGALGDPRAIPHLLPGLRVDASHERNLCATIAALGALGAREAVPTLITFLSRFAPTGDFSKDIAHEAGLEATIIALGQLGDPAAVPPLLKLLHARGGRDQRRRLGELVPLVLVALGRLGDRRATGPLLEWLETSHANVAAWALYRLADPAARPAVTAFLSRLAGEPAQTIYPELMLTGLLTRLGDAPRLDLVERALQVVMDNKFLAIELHEAALELLAAYAPREAVERLATPFLDAEQRRVRRAAIAALVKHGVDVRPVAYDRPTAERVHRERGAAGLRAAMESPFGVYKENLLRVAVDRGCGPELAEAGCAWVRNAARFPWHTSRSVKTEFKRLGHAVEALVPLQTPATEATVEWLLTHPNPVVRKTLEYNRDLSPRLKALQESRPALRLPPPPPTSLILEARSLGAAPWTTGKAINGLAFDPTGTRLAAVGTGRSLILGADGFVRCELDPAVAGGHAYDADFSPDGALLAVVFHAGHVALLDGHTGRLLRKLHGHSGVPDGVRRVRFSPDGARLATASDDDTMRLWDVATGATIAVHEDAFDVNCVAWSADGSLLAAGTDKSLHLFDGHTGQKQGQVDVGGLADVVFLPDGEHLACGGKSGLLVGPLTGKQKPKKVPLKDIARLRLSAEGSSLLAARWGDNPGVTSVALDGFARTEWAPQGDRSLWALAVQPGTGRVFCGGDEGRVRSWEADGTPRPLGGLGHTHEVEPLCPDPARDRFFTGGDDGQVLEWRLSTLTPVRALKRQGDFSLADFALSPDGRTLFATGMKGAMAFDLEAGVALWETPLERSECLVLTGEHLVVGHGRTLAFLDPATGALVRTAKEALDHTVYQLVRLADGRFVTADFLGSKRLELWNPDGSRGEDVELPLTGTHGLYHVEGAADGSRVYACAADGSVVVLAGPKLEVEKLYRGSSSSGWLALSPSGRRLAMVPGTVKLFDAGFTLLGDTQLRASSVAFIDEDRLLCGSATGEVWLVSVR